MNYRVGLGHDTHRLGADRSLILGGVCVPHSSGLVGHSDADVLLHALTDALLGAVGAGDIGEWFPDDDPANAGRDSADMLLHIYKQAVLPKATVVNVDCILFAQQPKLTPHKPAIRRRLAELLGVDETRVNVKAKTGEKVGPIGRLEAISAEVIVLVELTTP
ncbi:MAG: 2-C-methyl-D-erythritol 2,4-cyclodiphosphate synthase [Planctomycetia bacterium]